LQNRFLRTSLFHTVRTPVNLLYTEFGFLKLEYMIDMEYVKFIFRFCNNMLPLYISNYFKSLETVHHHNTCQKTKKDFFYTYARTEWWGKMIQRRSLAISEKISLEMKKLSFFNFKKSYKKSVFNKYSSLLK